MMKDILMCQRRFIKTMLKFELLIEEGGLSMNLQFKHSNNEIKNSAYWVIKNNSFLWIKDFNKMFEEYGTTTNEFNTNAPNYNTFKEIHDKYYNLLLGKVIPVSYKSLEFMFKDYVTSNYHKSHHVIINFDISIIRNSQNKLFFKFKNEEVRYNYEYIIISTSKDISDLFINRLNTLFELC